MIEKSLTVEQMLGICGKIPGSMNAEELRWLFESASRVRPGGCWVDVGAEPSQAFFAAGLGIPSNCRIAYVAQPVVGSSQTSVRADLDSDGGRHVARLRELRPTLPIDVVSADPATAADGFENQSIDVVFLPASRERAWLAAQLEIWRIKIAAHGRLSGSGWGLMECPSVTQAVAEALPGVSSGAGSIWTWTHSEPSEDPARMPRLSIIVATTGRASLPKTLASIRSQRLLDGDEILLVHDGEAGAPAVIAWNQARLPGQMLILANGPHRDWGAAARTAGQVRARGSHLLWQDDDDVYLPGAFDVIRREIVLTPEEILLFRLAYPSGRLLWKIPVIQCRNVSTQMYVIPRSARLGQWGSHYQGDFEFIETTVAANPGRPIRFVDKPTVMYSRPL